MLSAVIIIFSAAYVIIAEKTLAVPLNLEISVSSLYIPIAFCAALISFDFLINSGINLSDMVRIRAALGDILPAVYITLSEVITTEKVENQ